MFAIARNSKKRPGANIVYAVALMCGTALTATALEAPAEAQKTRTKRDKGTPKTDFSKEFVAAFEPMKELADGDAAAQAQAVAKAEEFASAFSTADDKHQGGILLYNLGSATGDQAVQLRGMQFMLDSGKAPEDKLGSYNYTAYQLASAIGDYSAARRHLTTMIDNGYTFEATMSDGSNKIFVADDIRLLVAQSYWEENNLQGGLDYLRQQIAERSSDEGAVPELWIARGLTEAYEGDNAPEAVEFGRLLAVHYPTAKSWGDAIAIQRNMLDYDNQASLDLLRLAFRTEAMREARNYVDYIEFADARRLPGEVKRVIDAGVAAGQLDANDVTVAEARTIAEGRIAADRADLPALERDARAASSTAVTASAAGDAFLSYGQVAKAEEMYRIALGKPGVDTQRVLTRLGIAQADQGKIDEAVVTFAKIEGPRKAIADLWTLYARQNASVDASATVAADTTGY